MLLPFCNQAKLIIAIQGIASKKHLPLENRAEVIILVQDITNMMLLPLRDGAEVIIPIQESMKRDTPIPTPESGNMCQLPSWDN